MPSPLLAQITEKIAERSAARAGAEALNLADNAPTDAEYAEDSAEVAESRRLTQGYVDPTEGTPPSIDEETAPVFTAGSPGKALGVPVPVGSTTFAVSGPTATSGRPVQIVPASGDRPRRVLVRCGAQAVELFNDSREGVDATTPAAGGYSLPATAVHETTTQGAIFAAASAAWSVSVWIDNYPAPVT